jgi:hypothetical protein
VRLEYIGEPALTKGGEDEQITGGSASPDGRRVVLRSHQAATILDIGQFVTGTWKDGVRIDLRPLAEPQGEGIAFGPDGSILYVVSEAGGDSKPGILSRLRCGIPR